MLVVRKVKRQQRQYMESLDKRCLDTSSGDVECQSDRKKPALSSVIVEALKVDSLQKLCSSLEPILRRVVREEVDHALAKLCPTKFGGRSSTKCIIGHDGRNLQLHFRTQLSRPLFTGGKVEGEQGAAIRVVLIDANTGHIVTSGPESSVKLEIVVLEGDFSNENDDDWTPEEFESNLVKEREGKRPLLTGELQVTLTKGVGTIGDLAFTDNSSWIRSRKFRLGLKVASGYCEGIRIREAKSEAFTVKDHRGELYKKHYPPALHDEVWRLEKIGKDGSFHKRLNKAGVYTVEDFLRLMVRDSQRLRNILGSGMSNKMWDVLVEHSKTCILSGKLYVYYPDDQRNAGVVFNSIYEFIGLIANAQYFSTDSLSETQKGHVDTLVKNAYENWMHVVEYDGSSLVDPKQNAGSSASQIESPLDAQDTVHPFDHHVYLSALPGSVLSEHPSGYGDNVTATYSLHSQNMNLGTPMHYDGASLPQVNTSTCGPLQPTFPRINEFLGICQQHSSTPVFQAAGTSNLTSYRVEQNFTEEEIRRRSHEILENDEMQNLLRIFNMGDYNHESINVPQDGNPYSSNCVSFTSQDCCFDDDQSRSSSKAVLGWLKLKAALRWGIFVRKKAAERRARLVELEDA